MDDVFLAGVDGPEFPVDAIRVGDQVGIAAHVLEHHRQVGLAQAFATHATQAHAEGNRMLGHVAGQALEDVFVGGKRLVQFFHRHADGGEEAVVHGGMRARRIAFAQFLGQDLAQQAAQAAERQARHQQGEIADVVDGEEPVLDADLSQRVGRQVFEDLHALCGQRFGGFLGLVREHPELIACHSLGVHESFLGEGRAKPTMRCR